MFADRLAESSERFLTARSVLTCSLLAAFIGLLKAGFSGVDPIVWSPESWPLPDGRYPHLSYGIRTLGFTLNIDSAQAFTNLGFFLIVSTLLTVSILVTRAYKSDPASGRLVALLTLSGPMTWILAGRVGHPDVFVVLGSAILGLYGHRAVIGVLGGSLLILGSPEQAVIISFCLLLLSFARSMARFRPAAIAALLTSFIGWLSLTVWSLTLTRDSRSSIYLELLPGAIERFFIQFPVIVYAGFGCTVLFVLAALLSEAWRGAVFIFLGSVAIPLFVTATTGDQGRVLVCISLVSVFGLGLRYGHTVSHLLEIKLRHPLTASLVVVLFLPAIDVTGNVIRTPWALYYPYIQAYLINGF